MKLSELQSNISTARAVIFQSQCSALEMFVSDRIKRGLNCNRDTCFTISNSKEITAVKNICNIAPPFATKWFVTVELEKFDKNLKDLVKLISTSTYVVYFLRATSYSQFKNIKQELKNVEFVLDFYVNWLRRDDFLYLYTEYVPKENRLNKKLFDYVYQSYSNDVSAVFELFSSLQEGTIIETEVQIADLCGVGSNSIESFTMAILKPPSKTVNGLKIVLKNRIKAGVGLSEVYNWNTFHIYLKNSVKAMIDLKILYMSGVITKHVTGIPEGYDEKVLVRYQRYLFRLREIPLTRLIRLLYYLDMQSWCSPLDFVRFIYLYTYDLQKSEGIGKIASNMQIPKVSCKTEKPVENSSEITKRRVDLINKYGIIRAKEMIGNGNNPVQTDVEKSIEIMRKVMGET